MKKKLILIISLIFLMTSLISCGEKPENKDLAREIKEKVDNKIDAYKTDLIDAKDAINSNEKFCDYIVNWASTKGIRTRNEDGIVVMSIDSSEEYKDAPPLVIICPYDAAQFDVMMNPIVMTLYAAKNNESTGALTAIFVPEEGHDFSRIKDIKKKYISSRANVICLNGDTEPLIASTCGASSYYRFRKKVNTGAPTLNKAYHIVMRGLPGGQTDNKVNSIFNPVLEINSMLAAAKRSSIQFEIADFRGVTTNMLSPTYAGIKVVIQSDHQAKFEERLAKRKESFDKKFKDVEGASFDYKEIDIPQKVMSPKTSSDIVGFIYTLLKGEYYRDEDTDILVAVTNITDLDIRNGKASIGSLAYSIDEAKLTEIDDAEKTLAGLSGFKCKVKKGAPKWVLDENSILMGQIDKAYQTSTSNKLKTKTSVTPTNANYISEINDKCEVASITVNENSVKELTETLINYMVQRL